MFYCYPNNASTGNIKYNHSLIHCVCQKDVIKLYQLKFCQINGWIDLSTGSAPACALSLPQLDASSKHYEFTHGTYLAICQDMM